MRYFVMLYFRFLSPSIQNRFRPLKTSVLIFSLRIMVTLIYRQNNKFVYTTRNFMNLVIYNIHTRCYRVPFILAQFYLGARPSRRSPYRRRINLGAAHLGAGISRRNPSRRKNISAQPIPAQKYLGATHL